MNNWIDTWECMEQECREEAVLIPFPAIRQTLDGYLKKHSFCTECTNMVNKAYTLLVEEGEVGETFHCMLYVNPQTTASCRLA